MTPKQKKDYNQMKQALERIKKYESITKLRKDAEKLYGLDYEETLEMAYENIQIEAKQGLKGVRDLPKEEVEQ